MIRDTPDYRAEEGAEIGARGNRILPFAFDRDLKVGLNSN
jgi:hypothetical protein